MRFNRESKLKIIILFLIIGVAVAIISAIFVGLFLADPTTSRMHENRRLSTELVVDFMQFRCEKGEWPKPGAFSFSPYYNFQSSRVLPDGNRLDLYVARNGERWDIELDDNSTDLKIYINRSRYHAVTSAGQTVGHPLSQSEDADVTSSEKPDPGNMRESSRP